jgi:hypothetical protein
MNVLFVNTDSRTFMEALYRLTLVYRLDFVTH